MSQLRIEDAVIALEVLADSLDFDEAAIGRFIDWFRARYPKVSAELDRRSYEGGLETAEQDGWREGFTARPSSE
jgi:hypothetical protein